MRYEENLNCVIINEDESKYSGYDKFSESLTTVLSKDMLITDPVFRYYFFKKNLINDLNDWENLMVNYDKNLLNKNFTLLNKEIYADYRKEIVECLNPFDIFQNFSVLFLIVIPTFYVITAFYLVLYYCKYRRINNDYQRLRIRENESNVSTVIDDGNELGVISSQIINNNI